MATGADRSWRARVGSFDNGIEDWAKRPLHEGSEEATALGVWTLRWCKEAWAVSLSAGS